MGSAHAPELPDLPLLRGEISVVAAHPEAVAVGALTEVVGVAGEMSLGDLTRAFAEKVEEGKGAGVLRGLWDDLVDDVLGEKVEVKVVPS